MASGFNSMKSRSRCRKCLHCKTLFIPDYRNRERQQYCSAPVCRKVSKQVRQQRWLRHPKNQQYFRDAENVKRVQAWRRDHPGYWKRPPKPGASTLQDACPPQNVVPQGTETTQPPLSDPPLQDACGPLQEVCRVEWPLLVGLIAQFTDCTLQDDIAHYARALVAKGRDILDQPSRPVPAQPNPYVNTQTNPAPGTGSAKCRRSLAGSITDWSGRTSCAGPSRPLGLSTWCSSPWPMPKASVTTPRPP